jgi:hypothetical protein
MLLSAAEAPVPTEELTGCTRQVGAGLPDVVWPVRAVDALIGEAAFALRRIERIALQGECLTGSQTARIADRLTETPNRDGKP